MAFLTTTNDICIPKGRVYFDECLPDGSLSGKEIYFGLTDDLTVNVETEELECESSECGFNTVAGTFIVSVNRSASLSVKNCSDLIVKYFMLGEEMTITQAAAAGKTQLCPASVGDSYIQLGQDATYLTGARDVENVAITGFVEGVDFNVDPETGRIYIIPASEGGTIVDGTALTITYDCLAATWTEICSTGTRSTQGALRFVSCNAAGEEKDWYMRQVQLNPGGDFILKSADNEFRTVEFSISINTPSDGTPAMCCDGRPV